MIVKVETFKIVCDFCGTFYPEYGEKAVSFPSIASANYALKEYVLGDKEYDWEEKGGKHLCPVCKKMKEAAK